MNSSYVINGKIPFKLISGIMMVTLWSKCWNRHLLPRFTSTNMDDHLLLLFVVSYCILCVSCSHHWIVTESGRIEAKQIDSPFPLLRSNDLMAFLEQEERMISVAQMSERLLYYKNLVDEHWTSIEEESEFEKRLYATDPDCVFAEKPLSQFRINPVFLDIRYTERPRLPPSNNAELPDCKKFHPLDFSLLTFPHLKTLRERENVTQIFDEVISQVEVDVDVGAMLARNRSDWTAYNLAQNYWRIRGNASNALECARLAIYFAPREYRYVALINMGTLLHACRSLGEAAIVLHSAVDLDRAQYRSHVALGHIYTLLGDYDRAAGCYQNALSLRPDLTLLAKQRAAVLCHQRLMDGLWAIEAALKNLVQELQDYSELQKQWILTVAHIGMERACGEKELPDTENLLTLWKAVEKQTFRLTKRLAKATPKPTPRKPDVTSGQNGFETENILDCTEDNCPEYAPIASKWSTEDDIDLLNERVDSFKAFMDEVTPHLTEFPESSVNYQIVEELVRLQNEFHGEQPKDSRYWEILERCKQALDSGGTIEECGHRIFAKYFEKLRENVEVESQDELLDESSIENYVQERNIFGSDSYHDMTEL